MYWISKKSLRRLEITLLLKVYKQFKEHQWLKCGRASGPLERHYCEILGVKSAQLGLDTLLKTDGG